MLKPRIKQEVLIGEIPHKLFYKIGEVSKITNLEPYVLRYWETEFHFLRPRKAKSKQRMYQKRDIEVLLEIKRLLYDERLTIEGVRKRLAKKYMDVQKEGNKGSVEIKTEGCSTNDFAAQALDMVRLRLRELLSGLKGSRGVAQPG